ncbi:MAG: PAS domain S-box protein [Rhodocyclaceae bacterium]|nr:PAS domain S-box protein [Rhodocyclaceae bacterium]
MIALPQRPVAAALVAFCAGLLVAALVARNTEIHNEARARERFERAAARLVDQLVDRIRTYEYGVRGARGAVLATGPDQIAVAAFRNYVNSRDIAREFPGVHGFGFIRRVPEAGVPDLVRAMRRDGAGDFAPRYISPHAGDRYLIQFIEPIAENAAALGLDIASEARRREAAERAMESGAATLTAPIELVQAAAAGRGFLLLLPVYRNAEVPASLTARREQTVGWAYAPLAISEVLHSFDIRPREFSIAIFDVGANAREELIHAAAEPLSEAARGLVVRYERQLFGRTWRMDIGARAAFVEDLALASPYAVFAIGTMPALLFALFTYALLGMRQRARQLSSEQARLVSLVGSSSDAVVMTGSDGRILDWNKSAERIFGYADAEVRGRELVSLLVPPECEGEERAMFARAAAGVATPAFDTRRLRRDGSNLDVSVAAFPILGADGSLTGTGQIIRDITERKDALRRLQELAATLEAQVAERTAELERSRHDLRTVLDAIPAMVGYWDSEKINRFANRAYAAWFGVDPASLPGRHIRSLLGEDLYARNLPYMERALGGEIQTFERSIPVPGGAGVRHSLAYYLPDRADGRVRGFYVLVHDVTELTESRLELTRERQRLDNILRGTNAGTWEWNIAADTLRFDERWAEMLGYALADWDGNSAARLQAYQHPDDLPRLHANLRDHLAGATDFFSGECRLRHRDGHWVWMQLRGRVSSRNEAGRAVWMYGTSLDISATKENERRIAEYQNVLERAERIAGLGGWRLELDGSPMQLSTVCCRIHGLPAGSRLTLEDAEAYYAPEARAHFERAVFEAKSAGLPWDLELPFVTAAGQAIWVRTLGEAECADGRPLRLFGTLQDISDRRAIEQALRDASEAAQAASAAKSEFLANISHEIRTPLNAVLGMTHLLARTELDDTQQGYVSRVQIAGRALLGVVNDVLDLSKIEAGEMRLEPGTIDIAALLRELKAVMLPDAQRKGLRFDVDIGAGVPAQVQGDALRLRQILSNLISNAVKFTDRGGMTLSVDAGSGDESSVEICWSVRDTGIGIAEEVQARLFTPFMQADASTTRRYGGTGLGLSIVRRLVELMGGAVGVSSALGQGSEFRVVLPMQRVECVGDLAQTSARAVEVFIATAQDEDRLLLTSMVRALGWRAEAVATADLLRQRLQERTRQGTLPDALLLDAGLPDLAHAIAPGAGPETDAGAPRRPALVLFAADSSVAPDPQLGAGAVLERPLSASSLFNALNAVLADSQGGRESLLAGTRIEASGAQWLAGATILVADDSEANLDVVRRMLEQEGAKVVCCRDGMEVLEVLGHAGQQFDAVLMDVQMPRMDGNEATRRLRTEMGFVRLPVIALTAGALIAERQRCFDAGMVDFISKPLDPDTLIRVLRRHIERARGRPLTLARRVPEAPAGAAGWPEIEGINRADAMQRTSGDYALFRRILAGLPGEFGDFSGTPVLLADAAERAQMAARLHKLRGTSVLIAADRLSELAGQAEDAVKAAAGIGDADAGTALAALAREFERITRAAAALHDGGMAAGVALAPLDAERVAALRKLLAAHDLAAIDQFHQLAAALAERCGGELYMSLRMAVECLEFARAVELLDAACPAQ